MVRMEKPKAPRNGKCMFEGRNIDCSRICLTEDGLSFIECRDKGYPLSTDASGRPKPLGTNPNIAGTQYQPHSGPGLLDTFIADT